MLFKHEQLQHFDLNQKLPDKRISKWLGLGIWPGTQNQFSVLTVFYTQCYGHIWIGTTLEVQHHRRERDWINVKSLNMWHRTSFLLNMDKDQALIIQPLHRVHPLIRSPAYKHELFSQESHMLWSSILLSSYFLLNILGAHTCYPWDIIHTALHITWSVSVQI